MFEESLFEPLFLRMEHFVISNMKRNTKVLVANASKLTLRVTMRMYILRRRYIERKGMRLCSFNDY